MRGEEPVASTGTQGMMGSPPRARGRVQKQLLRVIGERITPACAGKSQSYLRRR